MSKEIEIVALPKEKWKGTPIPLVTRSDSYYDLEIEPLDQKGCTIKIVKKPSEQEIVRLAEQERDRVLADAQSKELDMRYGAFKYTDDVFMQLESTLNKLLDNVTRCRQSLNENHQP